MIHLVLKNLCYKQYKGPNCNIFKLVGRYHVNMLKFIHLGAEMTSQ